MFRKLKIQFQRPVNRTDLSNVIKQGLFFSMILGIGLGMVGFVSLFVPSFRFLTIFSFIAAYLLSKRVKSVQEDGHIAFRFLGVLFFILTFYLLHTTLYLMDFYLMPLMTAKYAYYQHLPEVFNPLNTFDFLWRPWINQITFLSVFQFVLDVFVFTFAIVIVYKNSSFLK